VLVFGEKYLDYKGLANHGCVKQMGLVDQKLKATLNRFIIEFKECLAEYSPGLVKTTRVNRCLYLCGKSRHKTQTTKTKTKKSPNIAIRAF
jgi:translation initiation factor 2 beta subunit (eIF-2beta)/eIF-5